MIFVADQIIWVKSDRTSCEERKRDDMYGEISAVLVVIVIA